jgi:hypothetical protein
MPKINGNSIDPKAYATRMTQAKKKIASIDPATKAKLKEFYPNISNKNIVKKALSPKPIKKGPNPKLNPKRMGKTK